MKNEKNEKIVSKVETVEQKELRMKAQYLKTKSKMLKYQKTDKYLAPKKARDFTRYRKPGAAEKQILNTKLNKIVKLVKDGEIAKETVTNYKMLSENAIADTYSELYDAELKRSLGVS